MDNLLRKLIEASDDPKKPKMLKRKGEYTKKFNKWNKKMIIENKLNVYYADPNVVYDRKIKKFSKKSIDKRYKEPTLKKKFQKMELQNQTSTENIINTTNDAYFTASRNALMNRNLDSIDLKKISMNDFLLIAMDSISKTENKEYYLTANVEGTPNYITLSEQNIKRLSTNFSDDINDFTVKLGSDVEFVFNLSKSAVIKLIWNERKPEEKPEGAFFKYYHNLNGFDLTKFGLFEDKPKEYENCLFTALKQSGLSAVKLNSFISIMGGGIYIPCCKLNKICSKMGIHITIRTAREKDSKIVHYGNKELETIKIGLMDKHFFLIEKTQFTNFAIKHYDEIKHKKDWNRILRFDKMKNCFTRTKDKKHFIDTFKLYKLLLENKETLLRRIPIQDILATQYHDAKLEDGALEYDEKLCCAENELTKAKKSDKHYCVFFDFETITEGDKHKPYLMCALTEDNRQLCSFGEECGKNFLKALADLCVKLGKEDVLLIAHNTRYDYTFLMDYLYSNNPCLKGNRLMTGSATIYGKKTSQKINIKFQDTLNFLVCPLSKFPKMFRIKNVVKEVIPYQLYTEKNVAQRFVKIDRCLEILKNEKLFGKFAVKTYTKKHLDYFKYIKKTFMDNAKKWNCIRSDTIDIIEYSKRYCDIDCEILKKSYFIFRDWMLTATKLDLKNYCSIASMSLDYLILNGVFNKCFKLAGTPQQFIQKCVVGGRVQLSNNEKKIRVGNIADFDAVAEYPSAMFRMDGILRGQPKVIKNKDINWLMKQDGFFIKVMCVNEPTKNRAFPCLSVIDENGTRNFTNKVRGEIFYLDKTSYEDCVKFQGLKFEVLSGYYYDEGRNPKLKKVIKHLFDTRIKAKNEIKDGKPFKNPIEQVYKLLMNSCYGKCLLKPIKTEKIIKCNKDFEKYKARHFNYIQSYIELKKSKLITQVKPINDHFNNVYAGVEILSMSKRILGEVLYCAEDNDIEIFYVDTDSTHIFNKDIEKLGKMFKKQYNRELLGEGMGQFNSDFEMDGCKEVHSTMFIGLGKKCYLDVLSGINEKTGEIVNSYHIRMKGVSKIAIEDYNIINECEYEDTYKQLYDGETLCFDLVARGRKCRFEYNPDMTVSSKSEFKRKIKFIGATE